MELWGALFNPLKLRTRAESVRGYRLLFETEWMFQVRDYQLASRNLRETRRVTVCLPPGYRERLECPVVFCADGQAVHGFADRLSHAIRQKETPPVILVGVHSIPAYRAKEYVDQVDTVRFQAHEHFFADEVYRWVVAEFQPAFERSRCGVFGFSNGGAFALTMGARYREKYGTVIAFSIAGGPHRVEASEYAHRPVAKYYLSAGTREKPFLKTVRQLANLLEEHGVEYIVTERNAGHDFDFWNAEFRAAISWAFPR